MIKDLMTPREDRWDIHQGVYIDIFILHTCPGNKLKRYWQFVWAKYLVTNGATNRDYNKRSGLIGCSFQSRLTIASDSMS